MTTQTLDENAKGRENLAAIESVVAVENHILLAQNTGQKISVIIGLLATAQAHLEKLGNASPNDPDRNGWKKEIKAALDRAARIAKRLPGAAQEKYLETIRMMQRQLSNL
jgi:hypothetical protein